MLKIQKSTNGDVVGFTLKTHSVETPPLLTQENLSKYHTERDPLTLVLFDEIEKACDAL